MWLTIQPLINEGVAYGKPLDQFLIFDIVNWDVEVLVSSSKRRVVAKSAIKNGHYVSDLAVC